MQFQPSGIVTLLTDFGLQEAFVGIMKGVLLERCPSLRQVVDLTHAVPPQDVRTGAFQLAHAWSWFPPGTVHVAVVDPGVGTERRAAFALDRGHAFVAPDNGLLGPVLGPEARTFVLDVDRVALPNRSRTFHGRDVFAPAAAALAAGTPPEELGEPTELDRTVELPSPSRADGGWVGEVIAVDRFGNLITNLAAEAVGRDGVVSIADRRLDLTSTYGEVADGELVALVDSYGLVEVAVRGGSAAEALACGIGARVDLEVNR